MIWSPSECLAGAITTYTWRVDTFCLRHGDSSSHGNKPPSPPHLMHPRCVRKIGKSFAKITFYSHEEVVGL